MPSPLTSGVIGGLQELVAGPAAMTKLLFGWCVLVFGLCVASDHDLSRLPLFSGSFRLSTMVRFGVLRGNLGQLEPWRYVSAVFLHFSVLHLGMNALAGVRVGAMVEEQLGRARFVILFMLSGVFGFLVSSWWSPGDYTAGASGAVFGLFGCAIGVAYAQRDPNWKQVLVENLVWVAILGLINSGVNNAAHAGGLAAGALLGFLFTKEPRKWRLDVPLGILAALLLALSLASVVLSATSPYWRQVRELENQARY